MVETRYVPIIRKATHAGSWYDAQPDVQISKYLKDTAVTLAASCKLRAIIGPHAGYRYSGPTAAHAYINLKARVADFDRVVLLGPSHKVYLDFVATTTCDEWATPLGNLKIDKETVEKLCENSDEKVGVNFSKVALKYEENEHSLEMHLPFIKKVFSDEGKPDVKLVPLMVGEIEKSKYKSYAKALLPLFKDERTVFVISTDFCHWGDNFDYYRLHPDTPDSEIYKSIEKLDKQGMDLIDA